MVLNLLFTVPTRVHLFQNRTCLTLTFKRFFQSKIQSSDFQSIKYWTEGRVAHVQLNRPESLNAIDTRMPSELQNAVQKANWDPDVRVILLYGANNTFCSGYDLKLFAQAAARGHSTFGSQEMPWDPATDFRYTHNWFTHLFTQKNIFLHVGLKVLPNRLSTFEYFANLTTLFLNFAILIIRFFLTELCRPVHPHSWKSGEA